MEYGKIYRVFKEIIRNLKADMDFILHLVQNEDDTKNRRYWEGFYDGMAFTMIELEEAEESFKQYRRKKRG